MRFFLQNVQNEIVNILKMFKNNMKSTRAACWVNLKINNRDKNTALLIFLFCHYCLSLLWWNYWRFLMLWNTTSWCRLKLTIQIQLSLHPCDPLFMNMTGNSVEKCFAVLNVKLQVKLRFKSCYLLLSPWTPLLTRLVLLEIFAYPSNKRVIYGLLLNL